MSPKARQRKVLFLFFFKEVGESKTGTGKDWMRSRKALLCS